MGMADVPIARRFPSPRQRWLPVALVGSVLAAGVALVAWAWLRTPSPLEQMETFISVPSNDIEELRFDRYYTAPPTPESPSARLTATYSHEAAYDVHFYPDKEGALAEFRENLADFDRWPRAQAFNTYPRERCFAARDYFYCFGLDGNHTIRAYVPMDVDEGDLKALLLMRTARKHYYR